MVERTLTLAGEAKVMSYQRLSIGESKVTPQSFQAEKIQTGFRGDCSRRCAGLSVHYCALRLRGGDVNWAHREDSSSEMLDDSEEAQDETMDTSLHASELGLDDDDVGANDAHPPTDPALLAQRYWALPARSRQLLDDIVRGKWVMVTNSSDVQHAVIRDLAPSHAYDAATGADAGLTNASAAACVALTGIKLQEVWDGDTQVCVEVVEAGNHSGVHAGDLLRTVEGVDCSKRSIAEVGRLIAEANAGKLTVTLGMLHMSKAPNKREDGGWGVEEAGGGPGGTDFIQLY